MTSQVESIGSTEYTPLYKNELFESKSSKWRLLKKINFNLCCKAVFSCTTTELRRPLDEHLKTKLRSFEQAVQTSSNIMNLLPKCNVECKVEGRCSYNVAVTPKADLSWDACIALF